MQDQIFNDVTTWLADNVFNDMEPLPEGFITRQIETASGGLDENAVLYKWCPRRKRLVRSK